MRKNINRKDQSSLIETLNREFSELSKLGRFATAVVATYLTKGDRLTICNAGHPRPLYRKAMTGDWVYLSHDEKESAGLVDLPLGILDETGYTQFELALGQGDLVLIYTDALIEAEGDGGQQLGQEGLLDLVRQIDPTAPGAFGASLVSALNVYREGRPAGDDLTFILLHHNAGPARPPNLREKIGVYAKVLGLKSV
jgi:phosphoserine phosphatase RsbU/P